MSTKQDGDWGEALVEKYLSERGCRIVEREWRSNFFSCFYHAADPPELFILRLWKLQL